MIKPVIRMTRGDTKQIPFVVYDSDGSPMDLGQLDSITFTVKSRRTDPDVDALIVKDLSAGIAINSALDGTATITILPTDTSGLTGTRRGLVWDIQVVSYTGAVYTVLEGILSVFADITQG